MIIIQDKFYQIDVSTMTKRDVINALANVSDDTPILLLSEGSYSTIDTTLIDKDITFDREVLFLYQKA